MKRILAPILLLTLLFPSLAYGVTMEDLALNNGLLYKKFTTVPFTGNVTGDTKGKLKNGKRVGLWVTYQDNGKVRSKFNYKNGKKHGPFVRYYRTARKQLLDKGTFKNGKKDGPYVSYYWNGSPWEKGIFKNGKRDGPSVGFGENGSFINSLTGTFKNGKKIK